MKALTEAQAKEIRALLDRPRVRASRQQFVIEGAHLLEAALDKAPDLILCVAFTAHAAARYAGFLSRCGRLSIPIFSISEKLASRLSDTEESQGIIAVVRMPAPLLVLQGDFAVALDGVQDPGNVGTIIRTAAWFGVKSVLLGEGTADAYAPKVVRSTQGAIFSIGIETGSNLAHRLPELRHSGWHVVAATLAEDAKSLYQTSFTGKTLLLFGSEAHGIRPELSTLSEAEIIIPRYGEGESLNVAISAAIILAEAQRQVRMRPGKSSR